MTHEPQPRGVEYPSLEKTPPPVDQPPVIDYPAHPVYPGYPQPYPGQPYSQQPGTNGLAIASFVTALVGIPSCFGFGTISIVAVVLGLIGMNQIKRYGEKGHGLALSGVVIGVVTTVLYVLFFVLAAAGAFE